ncbi:hypothetical protein Pcinc_000771 [Petrolisthes cinctipes]|uniref:Uncharacterized protein n=1 Tax=Petrolisthes cinctipes TaxID=88211 RepID=A0AAE1GRY4_PETCI|nr:hypothetical protein Pcinc_000771 [Petrolisthes cinctipes]
MRPPQVRGGDNEPTRMGLEEVRYLAAPHCVTTESLDRPLRRSTNHRDGFYRLANNTARMIIMKARGVESGTVIQSAPQIRLRPGNRDPG